MPWKILHKDGKWCIYKHDADGNPVGESLGCHPSEADAMKQMAALHANMGESLLVAADLLEGGEGSGNFGHAGRQGEVGGSAASGGGAGSAAAHKSTAQLLYPHNPSKQAHYEKARKDGLSDTQARRHVEVTFGNLSDTEYNPEIDVPESKAVMEVAKKYGEVKVSKSNLPAGQKNSWEIDSWGYGKRFAILRNKSSHKTISVHASDIITDHSMYESLREGLTVDVADMLESATDGQRKGTTWGVTIIREGLSKNVVEFKGKKGKFNYLREALAKAVPLFEGAQVFANRRAPHVDPSEKSTHDEVAWISGVHMVEGAMKGILHVLPSAKWLKENLIEAWDKGKKNLYELSIHAGGFILPNAESGHFDVQSIEAVDSVDVVPKGAAGGAFEVLMENYSPHHNPQKEGDSAMKNKLLLLAALYAAVCPTFLQGQGAAGYVKLNENELWTKLMEDDKPQGRLELPDGMNTKLEETLLDKMIDKFKALAEAAKKDPAPAVAKQDADAAKLASQFQEDMKARLATVERQFCEAELTNQLTASGLPKAIQDEIRPRYTGKIFASADLKSDIDSVKNIYAKMAQRNPTSLFASAGQDEFDKVRTGFEAFFLMSDQCLNPVKAGTDEAKKLFGDVPAFRSFKEGYVMLTGDHQITGRVDRKMIRFSESLATTDLTQVVADALNKRMVRDYFALQLDTWRTFVDIVPLSDFKTQHRIRMGGYPNLATVAEGGPYVDVGSPTDEESTYAATKRGGTDDLTRELIKNDDVGAIQRIPTKLARAAAQTLHEFVYGFVDPAVNAAIYDAVALYHNNHSNTATTALAAASLAAARLRMKKQTELDNAKPLGLRAGYLLVPSDLEELAYELLTPAFDKSNQVPEFLQQIGVVPIIVDYWTDANNWALVARRSDISGLEIGFVDDQQVPQLFVSDLPNVGSWFTNDKITYKIRHEYGGAVLDYRAFDGSVVV